MRVTEALGTLGLKDDFGDELAKMRGTYVHKATAMDDDKDKPLDYNGLDDMLKPYVDGWRLFKSEMQPEILKIEYRVEVPELSTSGTLDRLLMMKGKLWLTDIKTGGPAPWHKWQVAIYSILYGLSTGEASPRPSVVYITSKGTYKWQEFEHPHRLKRRALALIEAAHVVKECNRLP